MTNARQLALMILKQVEQGTFADLALNQVLGTASIAPRDRGLITELVYGCVRQQRTLDALITQLGNRPINQQPPNLRLILHLGFYQLRYLSQIPASAVVDTAVELAKVNKLAGLTGVVNGMLRQYLRLQAQQEDPLHLPEALPQRLGLAQSYPDWLLEVWANQVGWTETEALCRWMNQVPHIDLRVNPLRSSLPEVSRAFQDIGIAVEPLPGLPQALRLKDHAGAIAMWPGFTEGWWAVQDGSAQLIGEFLDPQPGETIMDACAAPGGKTTHIAELMQDQGVIWACDRTAKRLKQVVENQNRLGLKSIQIHAGDSRIQPQFNDLGDRVLVDAPCSGLGTLHRHVDARWRQTPATVAELAELQRELLRSTAAWVKPGGILLYATCTLHPLENEDQITDFLTEHPDWRLVPPAVDSFLGQLASPEGWIKIWPHRTNMDGFFMAKLQCSLK